MIKSREVGQKRKDILFGRGKESLRRAAERVYISERGTLKSQ